MGDHDHTPPAEGSGQQAEQRLVHALLLHMNDPMASEHREQRVKRAMAALRDVTNAIPEDTHRVEHTHRFPAWARRWVWAAAATVLITAGIYMLTGSPTPAMASLNDILTALSRPGDRTYRIQVEPLDSTVQPRVGLHGATLHLRDGRLYLLVRADPNGGTLFDGYDGRQSWRIRRGKVVEQKDGLGAGGLGMPQNMSDTLFTDLQPTLDRIRVDYTIEKLDQAPLSPDSQPLRHVLARRNSRDVKGPVTIEIWADLKTGMPQRIVFDQGKFQGSTQPRRLTFELINETPLSPDWFSPMPHTTQ